MPPMASPVRVLLARFVHAVLRWTGVIRFCLLLPLILQCGLAAEGYVGAAACGKCHRAQFDSQSKTGHAHALSRATSHPLRFEWPLATTEARRLSKFRIRFDGLTARIDDGVDVLAVPMEWAFGAGAQAVTFVSQGDESTHLEHYLSYYTKLRAFGPTPGQSVLRPVNLAEAAGLLYKTKDPVAGIDGCFNCHSPGGTANELGVRCEACHGPGEGHPGKRQMLNPGRMKPTEINNFCGTCHRPPAADPSKIDWNYPWNVRHQPVYLSQSQCFTKSGTLTCFTCHGPHEPLQQSVAVYDARCANCHAATSSACAPRDCAGCHMPQVVSEPPLRFTNHWIGVYRGGSGLRPVNR